MRCDMSTQDTIDQIKQLLSKERNSFGLPLKGNDVISIEELTALEKEFGVSLPVEYKAFVTEIENGRDDPRHGMFTVQDSLAINRFRKEDFDGIIGKLMVYRYLDCCGLNEYNERSGKDQLEEFELEAFGKKPVLDDYFDPEIKKDVAMIGVAVFTDYIEWKTVPEEQLNKYRESMMKHILIFSFEDYYRLEFGLALDGKYAGEVVYVPGEFSSNLILTHMNFLDWIKGYYEHRRGYTIM